jgi:hypothetical protein
MAKTAVIWISAAIMVCALATCTYGVVSADILARADREKSCWALGGSWEDGWGGKWCNRNIRVE